MKRPPKHFLALMALACLAACAEPAIPFDRGAPPRIATIGVLPPGWPGGPNVAVAAVPGQSLLPIALLALAAQATRESRFRAALEAQHFDGEAAFRSRLLAAVKARGYEVVEAPADARRSRFVEAYKPPEAVQADAWLDCVVVAWGYAAASSDDTTPYRPQMGMRCRLLRAGGSVLMRDAIVYNPYMQNRQSGLYVSIAPDPDFIFVSSDDLMADPAKAVKGIEASFDKAAEALGTLLK